jgi:hypothetical protein
METQTYSVVATAQSEHRRFFRDRRAHNERRLKRAQSFGALPRQGLERASNVALRSRLRRTG